MGGSFSVWFVRTFQCRGRPLVLAVVTFFLHRPLADEILYVRAENSRLLRSLHLYYSLTVSNAMGGSFSVWFVRFYWRYRQMFRLGTTWDR